MSPYAPGASKQLAPIQMLRGVAVMLVMMVHAINIADFRLRDDVETTSGWLSHFRAINEFGACGVDLFFVISGFVMAMIVNREHHTNVVGFARDRFIRVIPLYWLANAVYVVPSLISHLPISVPSVLMAALLLPGGHYVSPPLIVGWSLSFEVAFYAIVAAILATTPHKVRVPILIVIVMVMALTGKSLRPLDGIAAIFLNPILMEFAWGLIAYLLWRGIGGNGRSLALVLIVVGCTCLFRTAWFGFDFPTPHLPIIRGETGTERAMIWALPWTLVLLGLLLRTSSQQGGSTYEVALCHIGDASYSLYLVHLMIFESVQYLTPGDLIPPDVLVAAAWVCALALGLLCHRFIERPMLQWLKRKIKPYRTNTIMPAPVV